MFGLILCSMLEIQRVLPCLVVYTCSCAHQKTCVAFFSLYVRANRSTIFSSCLWNDINLISWCIRKTLLVQSQSFLTFFFWNVLKCSFWWSINKGQIATFSNLCSISTFYAADDVVLYKHGERSADALKANGFSNVLFKSYNRFYISPIQLHFT